MTDETTPGRVRTPRASRRAWVAWHRKTDDSEWPYIEHAGVKGRAGRKFFMLSLSWGTKKKVTR